MKITLCTPEIHQQLLYIQKNFPKLTFQNNGYEYIDPRTLSEEDKEAIEQVSKILIDHVETFKKFNNFKLLKDGSIIMRFQYNWSASFTGVGYLGVDELLNGFNDEPIN